MRDSITIDRIKTAHPQIREKVLAAYEEICLALTGRVACRFAYVHRSFELQNELHAQGRSKPGKIVTWARGGQSYHNYGLALDIVLLIDRNGDGVYEEASWDQKVDIDGDHIADWTEVVQILTRHGFEWGGNWGSPKTDAPHFQMTLGYTIPQLLEKYNKSFFMNNNIKYPLI
jgi:peptidoglycan L-alanyl-D-glutamate endopeptidase CwlK